MPLEDVTAASALLIVEVADISLRYDLGAKARTYARLGLRELWVVDAEALDATIHRNPGSEGYADSQELSAGDLLEPLLAPQLAVRLGALRID